MIKINGTYSQSFANPICSPKCYHVPIQTNYMLQNNPNV